VRAPGGDEAGLGQFDGRASSSSPQPQGVAWPLGSTLLGGRRLRRQRQDPHPFAIDSNRLPTYCNISEVAGSLTSVGYQQAPRPGRPQMIMTPC
jgi:hypothetical protein